MRRILYVGNKLSGFGFTPTGIEFLGKMLEENGFQVLYAGEKRSRAVRLLDMMYRVLRRDTYEIIIVDVYSTLAFYFSLVVACMARLVGRPYITVLRGGNLPERLKKSPWLTRQVIQPARYVVAVSRYLQKEFGTLRQIAYIPNFISLSNYTYRQREVFRPRLLWVRSLHRIYNPELAVRLVAQLCREFPDTTLTMVGPDKDGSAGSVQKLAKELGVAGRVRLTGKLSKEEWIRLAVESDIFINTTDFDNMPVSVVEAMALGLPVVSTNAGGMPFLIEHGMDGLLVDRNDVAGFVRWITELIKKPEWGSGLARQARLKAEKFGEPEVARQWGKLLESIKPNVR